MIHSLNQTQAKWLKRAQSAFSDSSTYLDMALRTQWEDNVRMFHSKHPRKSKYNTELFQKRSNIFRPKTRASCMKFEAATKTAFFSTAKLLDLTPENPTDENQVISARVWTNVCQYRLTKTIPWFKLVIAAAQEAWKMGCVIAHIYWDYDKNQPVIELIPAENFRIDPSANWLDPINSSPYTIRMIPMYVHEIRQRMHRRRGDIEEPEWYKMSKDQILQAKVNFTDSIKMNREKNQGEGRENRSKSVDDWDMVYVHENIMEKNGQDILFYTLSDVGLLSDPVPREEVYAHKRPYEIGSVLIEPFLVYNSGVPELTQNTQEEINYIANDRLDNVHYVMHKRHFAKRGRNIDYRSLLRNIPGSVTLMDDPETDVKVIDTPDITASAYREQDRLNADFDEIAGNFSSGSVQTNRALNETVGGMNNLKSTTGEITDLQLTIFKETFIEPVMCQLLAVEQEHESFEVIKAIAVNSKNAQLARELGRMSSLRDLQTTLNVNVGISANNPQMKVERFMFALKAISEAFTSPVGMDLDQKEVVAEVFGQLGYKDGGRFFRSIMEGQDPRIKQLQQKLGELQQVIDRKQVEMEAKYRIDREKLQLEYQRYNLEGMVAKDDASHKRVMDYVNFAKVRQIDAEIANLTAGSGKDESTNKFLLEIQKMNLDKFKFLTENKTKRDGILANILMKREENEAKLKITQANSNGPSNDLATLKTKTKGKKNADRT